MGIRSKGQAGSPGQQLKHFTNRHDELERFHRLLAIEEPADLPALMFYGVGGTGKTWLLRRLREILAAPGGVSSTRIPTAYVDFDRRSGGPAYVSDFSNLLAEVWRQLDVECPRFEMAYAWMRFKQGAADRPLARHSGKVSTGWEFVKEGASAGLGWVPGFNLIVWATDKLGKAAVKKLEQTSLGKYLLTRSGEDDYLHLGRMTPQEIYPTLIQRLGQDLDEQLPARQGKRCRAVILIDTLEDLAGAESNEARRQILEEPLCTLYEHFKSVLVVMFGRDRLAWDEVNPEWADPANLQQTLLGGLSRHDALDFLGNCEISAGPLPEAILRVSRDKAIPDREAYYPFALGLCADTVVVSRGQGIEPAANTFDMAPGDYGKLAQRFLKSLHSEHPEHWIIHLAQTPRFDEPAARAAFSPTRDSHQDEAWESLSDYSFIQNDAEPGWFRIHSVMSDVLRRQLAENKPQFSRAHIDWKTHWSARSSDETGSFAALAWYHSYVEDPTAALHTWNARVEQQFAARSMTAHLKLLDWWAPTEVEGHDARNPEQAKTLLWLGNEVSRATLGNRSTNLHRAISCYSKALQVYTETDFPANWATIQNNLAIAYLDLPTGDRDQNLRTAISCLTNALRVHTETDFPAAWAATQNNLASAYLYLPTGDRGENLKMAISCYRNALRVRTESDFPAAWATTQNNLASAYLYLPTGDRDENLKMAITCYNNALRVSTESDFPAAWAATQNNLGIAFRYLPTGDRGENLKMAISCYRNALRVRTESDFPAAWATTQNNLGTAYVNLPTGDRDQNLKTAISCYNSVLRVRTESDFPADWAGTQNNLGTAYVNLPTGDRDQNLRTAITCYENALRVYTEPGFPAAWAMTQDNLGNAYLNLSTGDRDQNLITAITCYDNALRIRTERDFPSEWAATQSNLALAFIEMGRLEEAARSFENAERGYAAIGDQNNAEKARNLVEQVRRLMNS